MPSCPSWWRQSRHARSVGGRRQQQQLFNSVQQQQLLHSEHQQQQQQHLLYINSNAGGERGRWVQGSGTPGKGTLRWKGR